MAASAIVTGTATGAAMQKAQKRGGNGPPPLVAWHYSHPRSPNAERCPKARRPHVVRRTRLSGCVGVWLARDHRAGHDGGFEP